MSVAPPPPTKTAAKPPVKGAPNQPDTVRWHWGSALAGALLTAIVCGGIVFFWRKPTPPPIVLHAPPTPTIPTPEPTPTPAPLVVFVSGAVQSPGVYELPNGARVVDALARAGGFAPDANVDVVNQAAMLRDGDQLHVPTVAEEAAAPQPGVRSQEIEIGLSGSGAPVNVNTATLEELDALPGIGPTRAQAIIEGRPYASVDELERVPGIGPATLEELRPLITIE